MDRKVKKQIEATSVQDGAGVKIRRGIGVPPLQHLDPFLMLDHFGTENPDDYIAGFPDHPHRGFVTVTYMIEGRMQHRDSMGNTGDLGPGDVQWNLPAAEKMSSPAYQEFAAEKIPRVAIEGGQVTVISGEFCGATGPVLDDNTNVKLMHADLQKGAQLATPVEATATVAMYVFEGSVVVAGVGVGAHEVAHFEAGDNVSMRAGDAGGRVLLLAGTPIGEPIVQYGPFVMNTDSEIQAAFEDYQQGRLVQERAIISD